MSLFMIFFSVCTRQSQHARTQNRESLHRIVTALYAGCCSEVPFADDRSTTTTAAAANDPSANAVTTTSTADGNKAVADASTAAANHNKHTIGASLSAHSSRAPSLVDVIEDDEPLAETTLLPPTIFGTMNPAASTAAAVASVLPLLDTSDRQERPVMDVRVQLSARGVRQHGQNGGAVAEAKRPVTDTKNCRAR